MQHFLYFFPEPQLHGSLGPILGAAVAFSPGLPLTSGLKVLSLWSAKLWSVALAESTCGVKVCGTYGTPRGCYAYGVRTVGPRRGKLPWAFGAYSTQEAGTRSPHDKLRAVRVNTGEDLLADILHLAAQVDVVAALAHVVIRTLRRVRRRVG